MSFFGGMFKTVGAKKARQIYKKQEDRGWKRIEAAEKFREENPYEIPEDVAKNQAMAQMELGGKPAIMTYMQESADRNLSNNLSAVRRFSTSSADALAAASGANNQAAAQYNDAAIAGAEQRQQNLQDVYRANNTMADYKSMKWDLNINQPYLQKLAFGQQMATSGFNGYMNALNAQAAGSGEMMDGYVNWASNMKGGGAKGK